MVGRPCLSAAQWAAASMPNAFLLQVCYQTAYEVKTVGRCMTGADDRNHQAAVQVGAAERIEHQGSILHVVETLRIIRVREIERSDS